MNMSAIHFFHFMKSTCTRRHEINSQRHEKVDFRDVTLSRYLKTEPLFLNQEHEHPNDGEGAPAHGRGRRYHLEASSNESSPAPSGHASSLRAASVDCTAVQRTLMTRIDSVVP